MGEEYEEEADILLHELKPSEHVLRVYDFFKEDVVDKGIQCDLCWSFYQMIYIINTPNKCSKCIFIYYFELLYVYIYLNNNNASPMDAGKYKILRFKFLI